MKTATCIKVKYSAGDYYTSQRESGRQAGRITYKNGYKKTNEGNGYASNVKSSKLILTIEVDGQYHETWIDKYFKENIGRLTEKRVGIIEDTMPETVQVEENESTSGKTYYTVEEKSLDKWRKKAKL